MFLKRFALVVLLAAGAGTASAQTTLAATPPMGWNSWNWFAEKVTAKDIERTADLMVSTGMRDAGYVYVNVDDTWEGERDAAGVLHTNSKFPDMKALADYVHARGLKLGIYSSPGPRTCAGFEGSYGHEEQDARTYAEWGVDYLKYDLCSFAKVMKQAHPGDRDAQGVMMREAYETMHHAILKTGRPMIYSLCQYGNEAVWRWAPQAGGNLWRTTNDISASYDRMMMIAFAQAGLGRFASPGHWNDPDMLEVGNGKLTHDENLSHMTMWAILAAPLLAGNNLSVMTEDTKSILLDRDVIAIDQDHLGKQGERLFAGEEIEIWSRPLEGNGAALAIFNVGRDRSTMQGLRLHLAEAGFPHGARAYDVWAKKDLGILQDAGTFTIPGHGVVLLRLSKPGSEASIGVRR